MTTQDPELSAALGWPGGISDPVLDRKVLLQMVAALRLTSKQALEAWDGDEIEWFKRGFAVMENLRAALAQQDEPVKHQHKWFRTGAMEPGQMRCIDCGEWGKEQAEPVQDSGFWGRVAARQGSRIKQLETAAQQALDSINELFTAEQSEGGERSGHIRTPATREHLVRIAQARKALHESCGALRAALAQQAEPVAADALTEPKSGDKWRVEWWNESCRMMLPAHAKLDSFVAYKNGTIQFTIKRTAA